MNRKTLDSRDNIPLPLDIYAVDPSALDPLAVLISSRAVTAAKGLPKWEVKRKDWMPVP